MKQCFVTVILVYLVLCDTLATCKERSSRVTNKSQPDIEKPHVEALSPKGIRVFIRHVDGMEYFGFHGKINSPIRGSENGNLAKDVLTPTNGYWIFEDHNVQLRLGDVINYWIFVQINGNGHRLDNLSTMIRELIPARKTEDRSGVIATGRPFIGSSTKNQKRVPNCGQTECHAVHTKSVEENDQCSCNNEEYSSINRKLNTTLKQVHLLHDQLVPLKSQVESLQECLEELIKGMNVGTQLLLTGQRPPGTNALEAIRQLITEKLELIDLENSIHQAQDTNEGILFEMSSPTDKMRILFKANKVLKNSNYKIRDPQKVNTYNPSSNTPTRRRGGSGSAENQKPNTMILTLDLRNSGQQEPVYRTQIQKELGSGGNENHFSNAAPQENHRNSYRNQQVENNNRRTSTKHQSSSSQFGNSQAATTPTLVRPEIQSNVHRSVSQQSSHQIQRGQPQINIRSSSNRHQQSHEVSGTQSGSRGTISSALQNFFNPDSLYI